MASAKDIGRLVNGLSLIAKEVVKRSQVVEGGDFHSLVKKAVLSVSDVSGLTRGKVQEFSSPKSNTSRSGPNQTTVVYFKDEQEPPTPRMPPQSDRAAPPRSSLSSLSSLDVGGGVREVSNLLFELPSEEEKTTQGQLGLVFNNSHGSTTGIPPDNADRDGLLPKECDGDPALAESQLDATPPPPLPKIQRRRPRERRVPSTPFSRALGFAGLGAGLAWGTVQESAKRLVFGMPNSQEKQSALSPFLSEKNAERLALALCRMRGAALKLGQMLSIQDESLIPAPILAALDIVRQGADVMPRSQLNQVLDAELGSDWSSKLISFDYEPMAAASIGQVHRAVTKDGMQVAMKIQYPGVADSIESDIENVKLLLNYTKLVPEKLFLDRAMKVAKEELSRECDYELEAINQKKFRNLLSSVKGFYVPMVVDSISSKRVLTTELVPGIPIDKVALLTQETRNYVGRQLLELTLMELFVFRFMQTDPNWSNFLYDETTRFINLIDFGAARDFHKGFVDDYLRMVLACANSDRETVIAMSWRLGFLTGMETEIMLEAHVQAGFVVGLPFSKPGGYDFSSTNITQSISNLGATMLRHRLKPPPDEAYSLHRKLSGAFLACIKLRAVVPCRELLLQVCESYQFDENGDETLSTDSVSR